MQGSYKTDNLAAKRIIDSCVDGNVPKVVLISSLLTNGFRAGQFLNPQYLLLNTFGGTCVAFQFYLTSVPGQHEKIEKVSVLSALSFLSLWPFALFYEKRKLNFGFLVFPLLKFAHARSSFLFTIQSLQF